MPHKTGVLALIGTMTVTQLLEVMEKKSQAQAVRRRRQAQSVVETLSMSEVIEQVQSSGAGRLTDSAVKARGGGCGNRSGPASVASAASSLRECRTAKQGAEAYLQRFPNTTSCMGAGAGGLPGAQRPASAPERLAQSTPASPPI